MNAHGQRGCRRVASVEVGPEVETARGWSYLAVIVWMDDVESSHELALSWQDHDHWSGGAVPPSRVAAAVLRAAGEVLGPAGLPARCDAATLRRLVPGMDETLAV